jgi:hypothetical protein
LWLDDLRRTAQAEVRWLWQGYLAAGNVTLLTSQWKSGKTTLLSVLLSRLKTGGTLAGLPLSPGKAAIVSEEDRTDWLKRSLKLDYEGHVCWFCRPFPGKPTPAQWLELLDRLADLHARHTLSLVAIDSLSAFFTGRSENNAEQMLDFLRTLRRLTDLGLCVQLLHHPNKGDALEGQAARGSGALSAFVDILIEMKWHTRASETDRRRRLLAFSRHNETPRQLVIELNAEGTDYAGLGSFLDEEFTHNWARLRAILAEAPRKLTRSQLARRWPPDVDAPRATTLWRWLERAVGEKLLLREGTGRKNDPFRYWLPGQEEKWKVPPRQDDIKRLIERLRGDPNAPKGLPASPQGGGG